MTRCRYRRDIPPSSTRVASLDGAYREFEFLLPEYVSLGAD